MQENAELPLRGGERNVQMGDGAFIKSEAERDENWGFEGSVVCKKDSHSLDEGVII